MLFNIRKFALASAITAGIAYAVCAAFTALWPETALQLLGWLAHMVNVEKFAGDVAVTPTGLIAGLIEVLVYAYAVTWIFAWLYNRFTRPSV